MGVNLPKSTTLAGFRMTQVKQALKTYARTGQEENFFEVESFAPSRMEAAALYEELLERKFIDPAATEHDQLLTEAGLAIAGGKMRRSPLSTANRVLDDLLVRIERMNERSAPLNIVQRVWLFGSVMRREETVGDIDLAIETAPNPAFGDDSSRSARLRELVDQAPDHLPYFRKLYWHEEQGIFGERRHPLLAGAHMGSDELRRLGVPCQLIFDQSRGGRVDEKVIPWAQQRDERAPTTARSDSAVVDPTTDGCSVDVRTQSRRADLSAPVVHRGADHSGFWFLRDDGRYRTPFSRLAPAIVESRWL